MFPLPLKSRTRETGIAIGSKLGDDSFFSFLIKMVSKLLENGLLTNALKALDP